MKDLTVRRVLKDNKVPGTCAGTRAAEAQEQGLQQDSWERARLGCVRGEVLVWTRGALIGGISQKEKEKMEALSGYLENSLQLTVASYAPTPSAPGL